MENACCKNKASQRDNGLYKKLAVYQPLIVITLISVLGGFALSMNGEATLMNGAMAIFLFFLAALKLFNLKGFADAFSGYDLIAKHFRFYAYAYPFIELSLGCLYLASAIPLLTNILMVAVMAVGSIGVLKVIHAGETLQCGCVGAGFNLPVGRVTLFENTVMAIMAIMTLMIVFS